MSVVLNAGFMRKLPVHAAPARQSKVLTVFADLLGVRFRDDSPEATLVRLAATRFNFMRMDGKPVTESLVRATLKDNPRLLDELCRTFGIREPGGDRKTVKRAIKLLYAKKVFGQVPASVSALVRETGLDRRVVRRACREIVARGRAVMKDGGLVVSAGITADGWRHHSKGKVLSPSWSRSRLVGWHYRDGDRRRHLRFGPALKLLIALIHGNGVAQEPNGKKWCELSISQMAARLSMPEGSVKKQLRVLESARGPKGERLLRRRSVGSQMLRRVGLVMPPTRKARMPNRVTHPARTE